MPSTHGDRPSPPRPRHARRTRYPDITTKVPARPRRTKPEPASAWPAWTDLPIEAHDLVALDHATAAPLGRYESPIVIPSPFGRAGRAS
jgi:hypothetical protein